MNELIQRLRPYVSRIEFREFVRRGVRDWCDWHSEQTEKISKLRLVPDGESPEVTERRFPKIDALEGDPNYRLVAWADDERLTVFSKCALVALYWYRQNQQSWTLCPTPEAPDYDVPAKVPEAPTEPFELLLHIGDGREPSRFDAIDIIAQDVIDASPCRHDEENTAAAAEGSRAEEEIKGKRRGRKKADPKVVEEEAELARQWKNAKESGDYKADFARVKGLSLRDFKRLLDRVAKRKRDAARRSNAKGEAARLRRRLHSRN